MTNLTSAPSKNSKKKFSESTSFLRRYLGISKSKTTKTFLDFQKLVSEVLEEKEISEIDSLEEQLLKLKKIIEQSNILRKKMTNPDLHSLACIKGIPEKLSKLLIYEKDQNFIAKATKDIEYYIFKLQRIIKKYENSSTTDSEGSATENVLPFPEIFDEERKAVISV
jgi:hypothetical protein